ncbi:MAG: 3'(2'),5'-bisphosphate nucleotidase CysQ [Gammaproteobacteria bacterium]
MFANDELKNLIHEINEVARSSGSIIRKYFHTSYDVDIKDDKSPVTTADLAANEYIEQQLSVLTPDIPRISEESDNTAYAERKHWGTFWLIDPLDGTREFIENRPDFTVNIALVHHNQPVLGSIYLPIRDQLYYATAGHSAYRCDQENTPVTIKVSTKTQTKPRICGSRSHPSKLMQKFLSSVGEHELLARGSSIKSCLVADGSADIYARFGPTWEWDTAASQCIIEQAGGHLTSLDMHALSYNKESLLNPSFLAFANKESDWNKHIAK